MLTFVEAISLAGDRKKQNDDAAGTRAGYAWVIDGATDLHAEPHMGQASDAAWLASRLNADLHGKLYDPRGAFEDDLRSALKTSSDWSWRRWEAVVKQPVERWRLPTASVLLVTDNEGIGFQGVDLGDCRCFAVDANNAVHIVGGPPNAADDERQSAAQAARNADPAALLRDTATMDALRAKRAQHNTHEGYWVFGLQVECAERARAWTLEIARPGHVLLMTDGFSALVDRYGAYDAVGLVQAALDKGLQELGRELRAIEAADAGGAKHPRFKASDDATALLLRLT